MLFVLCSKEWRGHGMQAYLASEVLGPRDTWHCPKCREDVRAKKALDLWCLPEVLIIHLKRFSYSGSGYYSTMSSKIDNLVEFPLQVPSPSAASMLCWLFRAAYSC